MKYHRRNFFGREMAMKTDVDILEFDHICNEVRLCESADPKFRPKTKLPKVQPEDANREKIPRDR